jgi:hypothetical protein
MKDFVFFNEEWNEKKEVRRGTSNIPGVDRSTEDADSREE